VFLSCSLSVSAKTLNINAKDVRLIKITSEYPYPLILDGKKEYKFHIIINRDNEVRDVVGYLNSLILNKSANYTDGTSAGSAGGIPYLIELEKYDGSIDKYKSYIDDIDIYDNIKKTYNTYCIEGRVPDDVEQYIVERYRKNSVVSDWAKSDIEKALKIEIVPKDIEDNYNQYLTREQFCEMTANMLIDVHKKINLSDTEEDLVQCPFVDTDNRKIDLLYTYGIVCGKTEKNFFPDEFISEEEVITILGRISDKFNIKLPFTGIYAQTARYIDNFQLSAWSKAYFSSVICLDINFKNNTDIDFKKPITAEKAISMVVQMYNFISG